MGGFYFVLSRSESDRAAPASWAAPPVPRVSGGFEAGDAAAAPDPPGRLLGLRVQARLARSPPAPVRPPTPEPGAVPPYREPRWPLSLGPAPAFASGAAVRTRRPPAELGASKTAPRRASARSSAPRGQPGWEPPPSAARPMTGKPGARPRPRPEVCDQWRRGAEPTPAPGPLRPCGASCHRGSCGRTWAAAGPELRERPSLPP